MKVSPAQVKNARSYWKWLRGQFVDGIYANEWYNGKKATKQEYVNNKKSILLGMPLLRQMRIKKGNEAEISQVLSGFPNCDSC